MAIALGQRTNKGVFEGFKGPTMAHTLVKAGTRQRCSNYQCQQIIAQADGSNVGALYIGDSAVSSTKYVARLEPGQILIIPLNNSSQMYYDADLDGAKFKCTMLG